MEQTFSGYCRTMDAARMVLVEQEEHELDYDCDYDVCLWKDRCQIGQQIKKLKEEQP